MTIVFWVLSAGGTTARLFWKLRIILRYPAIVISLCLVTSSCSHKMIFFTLRRHQNQVQDHLQQPQPKTTTEHSAIQKGSINCTVAAVYVNRLLSTTSNISKFVH